MKRLLATLSAVVFSGLIAYAAGLPFVPSTPSFSDPSQIIPTLNALVQYMVEQHFIAQAIPIENLFIPLPSDPGR